MKISDFIVEVRLKYHKSKEPQNTTYSLQRTVDANIREFMLSGFVPGIYDQKDAMAISKYYTLILQKRSDMKYDLRTIKDHNLIKDLMSKGSLLKLKCLDQEKV